jgi:hypothetical protein
VAIKVKYRDDDLSHVWIALPSGLTRIPNVSSDEEFIREATLVDHLQWTASEDLRKDKKKPEEEQAKLDTLLRREGITGRAKKEVKEERAALPKKPSKKETRSDLRRKRDEEMATLQAQRSPPPEPDRTPSDKGPEAEPSKAAFDAMDKFMEEFA